MQTASMRGIADFVALVTFQNVSNPLTVSTCVFFLVLNLFRKLSSEIFFFLECMHLWETSDQQPLYNIFGIEFCNYKLFAFPMRSLVVLSYLPFHICTPLFDMSVATYSLAVLVVFLIYVL